MFRKNVREAEEVPWGYGVAYRRFEYGYSVICYPILFNWMVKWAREIYFWLAIPKLSRSDEILKWRTAYENSEKERVKLVNELSHLHHIDPLLKQLLEGK